jgi:hypothetical protein
MPEWEFLLISFYLALSIVISPILYFGNMLRTEQLALLAMFIYSLCALGISLIVFAASLLFSHMMHWHENRMRFYPRNPHSVKLFALFSSIGLSCVYAAISTMFGYLFVVSDNSFLIEPGSIYLTPLRCACAAAGAMALVGGIIPFSSAYARLALSVERRGEPVLGGANPRRRR